VIKGGTFFNVTPPSCTQTRLDVHRSTVLGSRMMKLRHTVALALVAGWLLLAPSADGPTAPLTRWTVYPQSMRHTTFPSKAACLAEIGALRHLRPPPKSLAPLPLTSGAEFADALCIAADDPRLKGK